MLYIMIWSAVLLTDTPGILLGLELFPPNKRWSYTELCNKILICKEMTVDMKCTGVKYMYRYNLNTSIQYVETFDLNTSTCIAFPMIVLKVGIPYQV